MSIVQGLDVRGNQLSFLPTELINSRDAQRINTYLKDNVWVKEEEKRPLNEAKVMFVGDPQVGKSSIIDYMLGKPFDLHKKETVGVDIDIKPYHLDVDGEEIRLNL